VETERFQVTVEVVPPAGPDAEPSLAALKAISDLPFDGFSVATNPIAKPRMSALALSALLQQHTGKAATLHCTTRDHNRLSLQGLLWGARALGINTVLAATGDFVSLGVGTHTTTVRDVDVFALVRMARDAGLHAGVVLDPRPESDRLDYEINRLEHKVAAGAQFVVTQPIFDEASAQRLYQATKHVGIPVILGILPLRTAHHAWFLHHRVTGVAVPETVQERMQRATDPEAEGIAGAREMLELAHHWFAGACLMPPFGHYEIVPRILQGIPGAEG
jgi:methylenetetrahydrofolate reductase (NADPH)